MLKTFPFLLFFCFIISTAKSQVSVVTQHNDLYRTGWNNNETILKPANVNVRQFGKIFKVAVDDQMYAQPLVAAKLSIAGGTHNVVICATVNNSVYAIDGDSGTVYWTKNYTPAGQRPPKNTDMTGACGGNYNDFSGKIGIVGTPVIDSTTQTIYFVARSIATNGTFYQYLHAVDLKTGNEKANSPIIITASIAGTGDGNVNGIIYFDPQKNNQRQALTLYNGIVYVTFSSHCDWQPYHGWILGYNNVTLQQKVVYNTTPAGYEAGIWQSGGGPSIDEAGNMYVVTGNGSVGVSGNPSSTVNRGESALKLVPNGSTFTTGGFFTPKNYPSLEAADLDYGSMGAFLVPNAKTYITGCKDGNIYVLNTDNLGGYSASTNNVAQTISLGNGATLRCQPSYYKSSLKEFVYVWSENSQLKAYPFLRSNNTLDATNVTTGSAQGPSGASGAVLSTSSNNLQDGTGIVWASFASNGDANQSVRPGILRAFDANDITKELWNSNQNPARDALGNYAKFSAPTIANGKVYQPTFSNQLIAYGIVDSTTQTQSCTGGSNLALNKPAYSSSNESNAYLPGAAFDGNSTTRWASAQGVDPQWIYVDLGQVDSICNITLSWEVALGKDFQVQVSNDAQNWNIVSAVTGNTSFINSFDLATTGRYVRIYGTARGTTYGYSLYEVQVFGKPVTGCITPTGVTVNHIDTTHATIRWNFANAASYNVQYKLNTATTYITVNTTKDSLVLSGLNCGDYYVYQVQSVCGASTASAYSAPGSFNTLACSNCGFLPTRYYTTDIGATGLSGQACFDGSNFTLKGSGNDIWDNADAFRFLYKTFNGNGRLIVKVLNQDATNGWNKAGLMFRETLDAGSRNAFIALTSGNGATFQHRDVVNGASANVGLGNYKAPYFLQLVKNNNTFTGLVSADSITWVQVGTATIAGMGNAGVSINAGLAVTSHDNTLLSTAVFNGLNFNFDTTVIVSDTACGNLPSNMVTADIGAVGKAGTACYIPASKTYKLQGSGINIFDKADGFRYAYAPFTGDGTIDVKVTTLDQANDWNKAGVMFRESTAAGSRNVMMCVTSLQGTAFQYRNATNGSSVKISITSSKAPYFVRLVKSGATYTGYISADSIKWKLASSITIPGFGDNSNGILAGIAVTSHDNTKLSAATFNSYNMVNTAAAKRSTATNRPLLPGGIINTQKELQLKVYPNPSHANFVIDFTISQPQNILLAITGLGDGRIYHTESLAQFSGNYHKDFSRFKLPKGSYAVTVRTKEGSKTVFFIKE